MENILGSSTADACFFLQALRRKNFTLQLTKFIFENMRRFANFEIFKLGKENGVGHKKYQRSIT